MYIEFRNTKQFVSDAQEVSQIQQIMAALARLRYFKVEELKETFGIVGRDLETLARAMLIESKI